MRADDVAEKGTKDIDAQIAAGAEDRQVANRLEIRRQPGQRDVVASEAASGEERGEECPAAKRRAEDLDEPQPSVLRRGCLHRREDLRLLHVALNPPHQQRRNQPQHEEISPRDLGAGHAEDDREQQHGGAIADRPAALHAADRSAANALVDDLAHQHGAGGPFAAEAEALHAAREQQLVVRLREA